MREEPRDYQLRDTAERGIPIPYQRTKNFSLDALPSKRKTKLAEAKIPGNKQKNTPTTSFRNAEKCPESIRDDPSQKMTFLRGRSGSLKAPPTSRPSTV